ncbi:MAG TPA: DNA-formamidopyrimidine glycosylase family protein [Phycisphaerales bacterium]|nr:DNA-formamidopyrimidine glycosylase family protein [Phycisphaerales bacterium]
MPELPDVTVYVELLGRRVTGHPLKRVRVFSPFLLRTFEPPVEEAEGRNVLAVERLGKRIVLALDDDLFLVIHLMIAGRFRWKDASPPSVSSPQAVPARRAKPQPAFGKITLAQFEFDAGLLGLTEASPKKRASLHVIRGRGALMVLAPRGLDGLSATTGAFIERLRSESRTLKRALTDPRLFDGVGNAYSDEILHAAQLSPLQLSRNLTDDEAARLHDAYRRVLTHWTDRLRAEFGLIGGAAGRFPGPGEITAFRPDFAVHGKFGKPCPVCGAPVQRIIYAENECNYCARCQTGGKVLSDRSMARLLRDDWPRTIEELEEQA